MKINKILLVFFAIVVLSLSGASSSMAQDPQIKTTRVQLDMRTNGVLYEPVTPGEKSHIGILLMHPDRDYTEHSACSAMSKRGYSVLCTSISISYAQPSGNDLSFDGMLLNVKSAVEFLRKKPGIKDVVLWGHSGGGALMSGYQDIAENGLGACQGPDEIYKCSKRLAGLPPADGVMLVDSNWGIAAMTLFALDPAIVNEGDGKTLNPALNMYNPANGFNPEGTPSDPAMGPMEPNDKVTSASETNATRSEKAAQPAKGSTYSDEFTHKFLSAEGKRNNRLIDTALARLRAIDAGKGFYDDDEPFVVAGGSQSFMNNKLYSQDLRLMSHTQKAWPLLRPDGSVVTQVIHSVRVPQNSRNLSGLLGEGSLRTTVRGFLSMNAVRVSEDWGYDEDSVHGIDWSSSYSNPPGTIKGVSVPLLVMGMTGSFEYLASETIYENAKSTDKTIAFVEGANHTYDTCTLCETYPGQYGDTLKTTYDYVDKWLSQKGRFLEDDDTLDERDK